MDKMDQKFSASPKIRGVSGRGVSVVIPPDTSCKEEKDQIHDDMDEIAKYVASNVGSNDRRSMSKRYIQAYYGAY